MKLNCVYCGNLFSISAEQLGGHGKCPHCHEIVYLPKADEPNAPIGTAELSAASSGHYLIAVLFAVVLHLLFLVALAMTVWGGNESIISSDGVRIKIGQPAELQPRTDTMSTANLANASSTLDLRAEQLQQTLTEVQWSALQQAQVAPTDTSESTQPRSLATLIAGGETLAANLNEDFGALLERLKRDGLDLVITFDSTGSMTGEINEVKQQIHRIGRILMEMIPQTRVSICTYRDDGDLYVVKGLPLTRNLDQVQRYLNEITAGGGGDEPEAVDRGLKWAIYENQFNPAARKVILLFGDAPPHDHRLADCLRMAADFNQRQGGVVSTVTCRNTRRLPSFEQIAEFGGGEAFLTRDEREIVSQLVVLVFGSQHQDKVLEAFKMLKP